MKQRRRIAYHKSRRNLKNEIDYASLIPRDFKFHEFFVFAMSQPRQVRWNHFMDLGRSRVATRVAAQTLTE